MYFIFRGVFALNPSEEDKANSRGKTKKGEGKPPLSRRVASAIEEIEKLHEKYQDKAA